MRDITLFATTGRACRTVSLVAGQANEGSEDLFRKGDLMKAVVKAAMTMALLSGLSAGQTTFEVTGTPVPSDLLKANYGALPKSIAAFDLTICNLTEVRQTVISTRIFQSLTLSNPDLHPLGRQLVLAAILRNQGHRPINLTSTILASLSGTLSILGASKYALPTNWASAVAFGSLLASLKPVTTVDQIEKFESQVLEPSFLLDGGSCLQRTVFTVASTRTAAAPLSFHVR